MVPGCTCVLTRAGAGAVMLTGMESPIAEYLRRVHAEISELDHGSPYLIAPRGAAIDPADFGICLATVDGHVYQVGVTDKEFSLQSLSKPLTYGLALTDLGAEQVDKKVDVEPSGESFTEISLAPGSGRPANAMINAGAIAVASLIKGSGGRSAIDRIVDLYSQFAGRPLTSSASVFAVERRNSDHNHALAYLLSSFGIIETSPTVALETYLRQCSVQVTCHDLAIMAATLANAGTNPVTGKEVLGVDVVERVLSVMMTSGMYDNAGDWASSVGMPAKSGVGGGTLAVLPGQAGLAVFSPPLDEHGTSVRGEATCRRLSADTEMHFVRSARPGRSAVRADYPITEAPSAIRRSPAAVAALREHGHRAVVIELGGDLVFAGTESMIREISELPDEVELITLDIRRVDEISKVAVDMLLAAADTLARANRRLVTIDPEGKLADAFPGRGVPNFASRSSAVAHCEDRLLERYAGDIDTPRVVSVLDSPALASLDPADAAELVSRMERGTYTDGEVVHRVGQLFRGVFFIVSGCINTLVQGRDGHRVTLSTLGAGMTFGEFALGIDDRQKTTAKAEGPVEVMVLSDEAIDLLERENPRLAVELWRSLTRDAYTLMGQYLREVAVQIRD